MKPQVFHFGASALARMQHQQHVQPRFLETSLTFFQGQHQLVH